MANEQLVSLDDMPGADTGANVSLDDKMPRNVPEAVANKRAARADYGLGEDSPGRDALANAIGSGTEQTLRDNASAQRDMKETAAAARRVMSIIDSKEPITQDHVDLVAGSQTPKKSDPGTVFELGYGNRLINDIASNSPDSSAIHNKAIAEDAPGSYHRMDVASDIIAKQNIADTALENAKASWDDTSWLAATPDIVEGLLPLVSASRLHNIITEGSLLPGNNLEEQIQQLMLMNPTDYKKKLEEVSDKLYDSNPQDAIKFLEAIKQYSATDSFLDSAFTIGDVAGFASAGAKIAGRSLFKKAGELSAETAADLAKSGVDSASAQQVRALKDVVKAAGKDPAVPEDILAAVGQVERAADIGSLRRLGILPTDGMTDSQILARQLPSIARTNMFLNDAGTLSREAIDRLSAKLNSNLKGLDGALDNTVRNTRLNPEQLDVALDEAKSQLRREFEKTSDSVIDVVYNKPLPNADELASRLMDEVAQTNDPLIGATLIRGKTKKETDKVIANLVKNKRWDALEVMSKGLIEDAREAARLAAASPNSKALAKKAKEAKARAEAVPKNRPRSEEITVKEKVTKNLDNVIDVRANRIEGGTPQAQANVETVTVQLGAPNATPFPTQDLAKHYAEDLYQLSDGSYSIAQKGDSFVLEVTRPLDETTKGVRALATANIDPDEGIGSFMNFVRGFVGSADEQLPRFQNEQRKAVQSGFNQTLQMFKEVVAPIAQLPPREKKDLERVLKFNRDAFDAKTGDRGFFYRSVSELEDGYHRVTGRLPSEKEVEAYYTYVQLSDIDWGIRNFSLYRDKARLGLKQFDIEFMKVEGEDVSFPRTPKFDGKEVKNLPWNGEQATVLHFENGGKSASVFGTKDAGINPEYYDRLIREEGYRIIQVDNPVERPFADALKNREVIQYVLTKEAKEHELPLKQLDYNPGGHVEYQHDWYVKQPRISVGRGGAKFYEGDTAMFNFSSEAQSKKFSQAMDVARQALKDKDDIALKAAVKKIPYTIDQFKSLFKGDEALDINQKFHTAKRGRSLIEDQKYIREENPGIRDYTDSSHNLSGDADRKFVGARNGPLMTVHESGSNSNPMFRVAPAKLIDPLQTMGRSLSNAANNRLFGDYKIGAVEDWIRRYGDTLKTPTRELENFPINALHNPEWNEGASNYAKVAEAKNARRAIVNFIGEQSTLGRQVEFMKQKLYNAVFNTFGEDPTTKVVNALSSKSGEAIDPAGYFRAMGFHSFLGLFNPVQYPLQAMGATHAIALSPRHGLVSAISYIPTRWLGLHPSQELVQAAGERMAKFGWRPADFVESINTMRATGWDVVGKEHIWKDNISDPKIFGNPGGTMLDKSGFFFNEGERTNRIIAWHTAYREWKEVNPLKAVDADATRKILNRADLLGVNMTRASAASWQKGLLSIPTQFLSYNARLMDQFLGKRLTVAEKARGFGMYASLYGVPAATGLSGWYGYEDMRTRALDNGWDTQSNVFVSALHNGILQTMSGLVTGEQYNVADRYGPGGMKVIRDTLKGDRTFWQIVGGASGSVVGDMATNGWKTAKDMYDVFKENGPHEPLVQDVLEMTKSISSVNNASKVIMAMNTQKYYTKNGKAIQDITTQQALVSALTGLQPVHLADSSLRRVSNNDYEEMVNAGYKEFETNMRRGMQAGLNGDTKERDFYFKKASAAVIAVDLNPSRRGLWMQRFYKDNGDIADRTDDSFAKNGPASTYDARMKQRINSDPTSRIGN